ncbi:MAG: protein-disulfide reductase DsbD domain-containing protein [Hyphomicrobiaceae bacterium]
MTMVRSYALVMFTYWVALCAGAVCSNAGELASAWSEGKRDNRTRLVAGTVSGQRMAAVEIALGAGWKTYWRVPGDAGGVPPVFDWSKSENVDTAKVLYPVPTRFSDKDGDILGFKNSAIFPVVVTPKDAGKPVRLVVVVEYGICREICIPVEAELSVAIPAGDASVLPAAVISALEQVPRPSDARRPMDPKLTRTVVVLDGPHPSLVIEAEFPGGAANAALIVESSSGDYIPLPKAGSAKPAGPDKLRFEIDLTGSVDPAGIRGKDGKATLVSAQGLTEATFKFE